MRILLISNIFPPGFIGGYELGALDIARGLVGKGHDLLVLTSDYLLDDDGNLGDLSVQRVLRCLDPSRREVPGAERIWAGGCILPENIRRVGSAMTAFRPDAVLLFNTVGLGSLGLLRFLAAAGHRPVVYLMDNVYHQLRWLPKGLDLHGVFGTPDFLDKARFISLSRRLQVEVEQSLGRTLGSVSLVPGWPAVPATEPEICPVERAPGAFPRFVFSSRVVAHKGIDLLVDAARLLRDGGHRNFSVDLFGSGDVPQFVQRVAAEGLTEHLRYCGVLEKPQLLTRLFDYDALLLPTMEREPFAFVVAEAAYAGCIPVMTAGIGAAEWFFDGVDCLKITRSSHALADAMLHLLHMPEAGRFTMRRRSAAMARRFFAFGKALNTTETLLGEAAAESASPDAATLRAAEAAMMVLDDVWSYR